MMNEKEIGSVLIATIVLTFVVTFKDILNSVIDYTNIGILFIFFLVIISVNLFAKKTMAHHYEATLETQTWNLQRFGFKPESQFRRPMPFGIILPIVGTIFSQGNLFIMATLESKIEGTSARAVKSHGRFRFTEMTDNHISYIFGAGVIANLVLAIASYLMGLGQLAQLSIYYATWSLIPIGNLDGTKIFFGSKNFWFGLLIATTIFLSYALFIPR